MRHRNQACFHRTEARGEAGFTLVEMIVVIVLTGIVASMVAVFIKAPIDAYFDAARRAELTDVADTALRRMGRDLQRALPNSVRLPSNGSTLCVEFLGTSSGGRYRAECSADPCPGGEDKLDFTTTDTGFDVLGSLDAAPAAGDRVAVYNLGIPGADAYNGDNTGIVAAGSSATHINLAPGKLFPFESPGKRFQVIPAAEQGVSYVCSNPGVDAQGSGTGVLYRYAGYGINASLAACPAPPAGTPILAGNVESCAFAYSPGVTERSGLVTLQLKLRQKNESVSLYHEIHVSNVP